MARKLYVRGFPYETTDEELHELFSQHGEVASAKTISDRETGRPRGFGFVEFENDEEAEKAIKALDGSDFGGRKIFVNEARPREDRPRNNNFDRR